MTFEQFQKTRQWCEDLSARLPGEALGQGSKGYVYCGSLFIEDATAWPESAPGYGRGHWYTVIGRVEYQSDDLQKVERPLYEFAVSGGYSSEG
jgi:hypothetical protein